MLAMALLLQRYSSNRNNEQVIKEADERWVQCNKRFLLRDNRLPCTILANYCAELDFTEDLVDAELDWHYFTNDSEDTVSEY